ncbi:hypothetical protein I4F81_000770 [Pyropia yezoensis]|uniref:Uncharacterized protein n=1 Tax=Pyropia yezoensis TaxID=2788 RepID=A0ACC3BKA9_PYRYE|nr:hypothetical protein I4F81_000770 [Neopyropia yezoensis]
MWRANAFFADQSDCVGLLLQHAHVHYERPGQFGKTTLLEMLGAFVDRFTTNADFQVLFGGTKAAAIYHPLRQQCHIVRISLSIDARRPLHEIPELLSAAVNDGVRSFQVAYPDVHVNVEENGIRTLSSLGIAIAKISARESSGWKPQYLTFSPQFSRTLGLSKADVLRALNEVIPADNEGGLTQTQQNNLFDLMHRLYTGYMFPGMEDDVDAVFNPALCRAFFYEL